MLLAAPPGALMDETVRVGRLAILLCGRPSAWLGRKLRNKFTNQGRSCTTEVCGHLGSFRVLRGGQGVGGMPSSKWDPEF